MDFKETFEAFLEHEKGLKVVHLATCGKDGKPNSAPKLLVNIQAPNKVYVLDYKSTQTFKNIDCNRKVSLSFMDDDSFTGYRLTGDSEILESGPEFDKAKRSWEKRLIHFEADRIIRRIRGNYSTKESENKLPPDFVIIKLTANEAAVVKPGRVLRSAQFEQEDES
jgi:general stress protein 26